MLEEEGENRSGDGPDRAREISDVLGSDDAASVLASNGPGLSPPAVADPPRFDRATGCSLSADRYAKGGQVDFPIPIRCGGRRPHVARSQSLGPEPAEAVNARPSTKACRRSFDWNVSAAM